ncbi:hypothetical protein ScPMuIL_013568 [Solemya velum]
MEQTNGNVSNGAHGETNAFLRQLFEMMLTEGIEKGLSRDSKVVEFKHPKDLEKIMNLKIDGEGASDQDLLDVCSDVIKYSVKAGHPHFFNQLFGGIDQYSLGGSWLTDCMNTSQYTYEVAPVFTLMEKVVLTKMLELIGFNDGDAIFTPGGSMANMYAINVARFQRYPEVKQVGMAGVPKLCLLTSDKGHYSFKKGASFLGIGMDNVIPVKTNDGGKMIPVELETKILELKEQGLEPYFVNATAGTTVLGVFDPLDEIADICKKYGLWMHVDAAWGGSVLLSQKHKHMMKGIERADSMTWNPHKMMGPPLQCAAFLTRHKDLLKDCHCANARYLFQQDKFYDVSYDTGDKAIQCGRKVDALKLWMMWKAKGDSGFERDVDKLIELSRYLTNQMRNREGFRVVAEPECTNVCFWYIPPSLRGQEETSEWWQKVAKVAPVIKQRMTEQGTMLIGYQPDGDRVNFFRMIVSNMSAEIEDMTFVVNEIERLGKDL